MENNHIYALTSRGQDELRSGSTTLSPSALELLIRIDGVLTLGQIEAGIGTMTAEAFASIFQNLLDRNLVKAVEIDTLTEEFNRQLSQMELTVAESEADAGVRSLKTAGYYVSIAHKRAPIRPLVPGEQLSAIVVEDDAKLGKFIQSYLAFEGFRVRLAGNRAEVIAEFNTPPIPNLILLDVMLPDIEGFDILLRLRQHHILKNVPIIMMTGKATREAVIKGLASGADGYVTKPFEINVLMRAVRTVVGLQGDTVGLLGSQWEVN